MRRIAGIQETDTPKVVHLVPTLRVGMHIQRQISPCAQLTATEF
jgi:hypothetical protein